MTDWGELALGAVLVGTIATAILDLWSAGRKRFFGVAAPDYALVGRWLAYMPRGRFHHASIAASAPVSGERAIGWTAHYLIGICFAAILLAIWGTEWASSPTIVPALIIGVGSVLAPYLLMQPAMGAGIAARRTPDPAAARWRSLLAHTVFAIGLYLAGWLVSFMGSVAVD